MQLLAVYKAHIKKKSKHSFILTKIFYHYLNQLHGLVCVKIAATQGAKYLEMFLETHARLGRVPDFQNT